MKTLKAVRISILVAVIALVSASLTTACSGGNSGYTRSHVNYGAGYRGYYRRPWGYAPVYVGGGVDPDWGVERPDTPVAVPLPEMGMPDMGGGMDMDMGGFDW